MSKLKLARILKGSQAALDLLDASGVNVDRLIGISNAQGPQARIIRSLISAFAEEGELDEHQLDNLGKDLKQLKPAKSVLPKRQPKIKKSTKTTLQ